jgi:SAM-dependent methyltransferase
MPALPDAVWRAALSELLRHLPPSGSTLRLLYIGAPEQAAAVSALRADLDLTVYDASGSAPFRLETDHYDAILAQGTHLREREPFLRTALTALRLGGRLIMLDAAADAPEPCAAQQLETANSVTMAEMQRLLVQVGYVRVLIERLLDGCAVLSRGERDYTQLSTLERVQRTAERDITPDRASAPMDAAALQDALRGNFIFALIRQDAARPTWEAQPQSWRALTVVEGEQVCLPLFSGLPKAVAFMQAAIKAGVFSGVNKIGKFHKRAAQEWQIAFLLNPTFDASQREGAPFVLDPRDAVTGEE